jgi:hypothetical protein
MSDRGMSIESPEGFFWGIDYAELREQKQALLDTIWDDNDSPLWGIVHLIDGIQDYAADDLKIPNVFAFEGLSRDTVRGLVEGENA